MNREAYDLVIDAQKVYLIANGWVETSDNKFEVPEKFGVYAGDIFLLQRAFEFQLSKDVQEIKRPT